MELPDTHNDVPAHLNELIPYRCPKCGHQRRFATLRELRLHLQNDHSFQMGFIKPHVRANIFDSDSKLPKQKLHKTFFDGASINMAPFETYRTDKEIYAKNTNKHRESSPLLDTFRRETAQLELELEQAKQQEVLHKAQSMSMLAGNEFTRKSAPLSVSQNKLLPDTTSGVPRTIQPLPLSLSTMPEIQHNLGTLNREVMTSRVNQWASNDALYKSQEVLQDLENAADMKCQEQKEIIQKLLLDIKDRDHRMTDTFCEQQKLKEDRNKLFDETERLVRQADEHNKELREELNRRSHAIEVMNKELDKLNHASQSELMAKEKDLKNTRERMKQLEWERDSLVKETEKIVQQADEDNQDLRQAIQQKEREIASVTQEMNRLKSGQQTMLEKTMSVYRKSEENKKLFKTALQAKEEELQMAMRKIAEMSGLQKQLLDESRILTDQADENTESMKRLLQMKENQVLDVVHQLKKLKREKEALEHNTASLTERAGSTNTTVASLKGLVKSKEKELQTTQTELQQLKTYLQDAADRERVARKKLELFIEDLLTRAETAEIELRALRSQSRSQSTERFLNDAAKPTAVASTDTLANVGQLHNETEDESYDATERMSLPHKPYQNLQARPMESILKRNTTLNKSDWRNALKSPGQPVPNIKREKSHMDASTREEDTDCHGYLTENNIPKRLPNPNHSPLPDDNRRATTSGFVPQRHAIRNNTNNLLGESYGFQYNPNAQPILSNEDSLSNDNTENIVGLLNHQRRRPLGGGSPQTAGATSKSHEKYRTQDKRSLRCELLQSTDSEYDHYPEFVIAQMDRKRGNWEPSNARNVSGRQYGKERHDTSSVSSESENSSAASSAFREKDFKSKTTREIIRKLQSNILKRQMESRKNDPKESSRHCHDKYSNTKQRHSKDGCGVSDSNSDESIQDKYIDSREGRSRRYQRHCEKGSHSSKVTYSRHDSKAPRKKHAKFDSRYPETHRSMVNLKDISPDGRKRERDQSRSGRSGRDRRSRSASISRGMTRSSKSPLPRYMPAKPRRSSKGDADKVPSLDDKTPSQIRSAKAHVLPTQEPTIVQTVTVKKLVKSSEDPLQQLMDDNGILWDDENDTLPDVSDSEFDRVSPSGSEAINRKTTSQTPTKQSKAQAATSKSRQREALRSNDNHTSNRRTVNTVILKDDIKRTCLPRNISDAGNGFVPIKDSVENKSSISDKDMTSGGKEVHNYCQNSPSIAIKGMTSTETVESPSSSLSNRTKTRSNTDINTKDNANGKSSNHVRCASSSYNVSNINSRQSRSVTNLDLEAKIKSINDKYKQRRKDIVENKVFYGSDMNLASYHYSGNASTAANAHIYPNHESMYGLRRNGGEKANQLEQLGSLNRPHPIVGSTPNINTHQFAHPQVPFQNPAGHPQFPYYPMDQYPYHLLPTGQTADPSNPSAYVNQPSFPYIFPYFMNVKPGEESKIELPVPSESVPEGDVRLCQENTEIKTTKKDTVSENRRRQETEEIHEQPQGEKGTGDRNLLMPTDMVDKTPSVNRHQPRKPTSIASGKEVIPTKNNADISKRVSKGQVNKYSNNDSGSEQNDASYNDNDYEINMHYQLLENSPELTKQQPRHEVEMEYMNPHQRQEPNKSRDASNTGSRLGVSSDRKSELEVHSPSLRDKEWEVLSTEKLSMTKNNDLAKVSPAIEDDRKDLSMVDDAKTPMETYNETENMYGVDNNEHVVETDDIDSVSVVGGYGLFAEPIVDESSAELYSSIHSLGPFTDTDTDADTDSVRRDFYESSKKIKEILQDNSTGSVRQATRNTLSTTSSQASFDMLDSIPKSRREDVRRRRQALCCIFAYLDTPTLCRAASVCREWRLVTRSPKLWQRVELRNNQVTSKFLFHVARRCSKLKVLILEDLKPRNRKPTETVEEYQANIQCSLESGYEQILKRSEATLHTIRVVNCGTLLSSKCLWAASCYSRMLKHVTFMTNFDLVTPEVMWALGSGCRELQTLDIKPILPCQRPENFTTRCVQLIGKCFRDLRVLTLGGREIDTSALIFVAKQCQKLVTIECYSMSLVTKETMEGMCQEGLRALRIIKFNGTPIVPECLLTLYENCRCLEMVTVQMTVNDFFHGTNQPENLKVYRSQIMKFDEILEKHPRLRPLVSIQVDRSITTDESKPEGSQETQSFWDRLWN